MNINSFLLTNIFYFKILNLLKKIKIENLDNQIQINQSNKIINFNKDYFYDIQKPISREINSPKIKEEIILIIKIDKEKELKKLKEELLQINENGDIEQKELKLALERKIMRLEKQMK